MIHNIIVIINSNLDSPLANITVTSTNTAITMTWTPPSFAPPSANDYHIYRQCRIQCEQTFDPNISAFSISSPYTITGIAPGTYCIFGLIAFYGSDQIGLGSRIASTLSSGKVNNTLLLSQCFSQIITAPTSPVSNITISSVQARSMIVSWNEVPCSGQNGPITGYLLHYTNGTFSDTIYITGGSYRQHILATITPHTNYTVRVTSYNDGGIGPVSSGITQQTKQAGKLITALT